MKNKTSRIKASQHKIGTNRIIRKRLTSNEFSKDSDYVSAITTIYNQEIIDNDSFIDFAKAFADKNK